MCRNGIWELSEINWDNNKTWTWTPVPAHLACKSGNFAWEPLLGKLAWEPVPRNLFLEPLLGNLFGRNLLGNRSWEPVLGNLAWGPCLGTCSWELWEPCFGTSSWEPFRTLLENLAWEPCLGTWLGNLLLRTLLGNLFPGTFGNLAWEPAFRILGESLGTSYWEPLGTLLGELFLEIFANLWEPAPRNLWGSCLGPLLGNLLVGTLPALLGDLAWEPRLGTRSWEPLQRGFLGTLANLAWEPFLGTLGTWLGNFAWKSCLGIWFGTALRNHTWEPSWEPLLGNLLLGTFANLAWEPAWEPSFQKLAWELGIFLNLFLGTLEPALGNLFLRTFGNLGEPALGNLWKSLGTCSWQLCLPCLGTFANLAWERCLETRSWEPLWIFGNRTFAILAWEPSWEPFLGNLWEPGTSSWTLLTNLAYKPCLRTSCWEPFSWKLLPGNLFLGTFAIPAREPCLGTLRGNLGTLRSGILAAPTCSGTSTMSEDIKLTLLGKNLDKKNNDLSFEFMAKCLSTSGEFDPAFIAQWLPWLNWWFSTERVADGIICNICLRFLRQPLKFTAEAWKWKRAVRRSVDFEEGSFKADFGWSIHPKANTNVANPCVNPPYV